MTARNPEGEVLFQTSQTWFELGLDVEGNMQYGAWLIKETVDLALQPLETHRLSYLMHFDPGTREAHIEARLRYYLDPDRGETVEEITRQVRFDE